MQQVGRVWGWLTGKSHESEAMENERQQRMRQVVRTGISSGGARGVAILVQIAIVPLTLGYLGQERYGMWMVISSLIAFLQMADLGLSNGLIGIVADRVAKKQNHELRKIIISAYAVLSFITLALILFAVLIIPQINWQWLLNFQSVLARQEITDAVLVLVVVALVSVPFNASQQIRLGMQEGATNGLFTSSGSVLNLILIIVVIHMEKGLPWLVAASMSGSLLAQIIHAGMLCKKFCTVEKQVSYSPVEGDTVVIGALLSKGVLFFVLQLSALVSYSLDNLLVSHFLGSSEVSVYAVTMKLFSIPGMLLSLYLVGMWPAYADASARNDKPWIEKIFWRSLRVSIAFNSLISLLLLLAGNWLIHIWTKGIVQPDIDLLVGMALWGILNAIGGNIAVLLNGLHVVRFQVLIALGALIMNAGLSLWLVQKIGVSGPIWGSVATLLGSYVIIIIYIKKMFSRW